MISPPTPTPPAPYVYAGSAAVTPQSPEEPGPTFPCSVSPFWLLLSPLALHCAPPFP